MAAVDPDDDTLHRYVVRHYRYDPERRERRHVVVAAFDDPDEQLRALDELTAAIQARRDAGEDVDPEEHASGVELQVGYRRLQANARLLRSAITRGLAVPDLAETIQLPQGVSRLVVRDLDE